MRVKQSKWQSVIALLCLHAVLQSTGEAMAAPSSAAKEPKASREDLTRIVQERLRKEMGVNGGFVLVADPATSQPLRLSLIEARQGSVRELSENVYLGQALFRSTRGALYDLEILVGAGGKDKMRVLGVKPHLRTTPTRADSPSGESPSDATKTRPTPSPSRPRRSIWRMP